MRSILEFTGTPSQMRAMYEHGWGVAEIMYQSGKTYEQVTTGLRESGTTLVTGGPHAFTSCRGRHDHTLAHAHANGARCCEAKVGRKR